MTKFLLLTKVLLKSGLGNGVYEENGDKGKWKKTLLYLLVGICLIPFAGLMGYIGYAGYNMFDGFNTGIILGITCYAGVFLAFFSGVTMSAGIFFNSADTVYLLPLPFKAEQIVGAKFVTMYVYTFLTDLLFIFPVFIGYGIAGRPGEGYWIMSVAVAAIIPITPLIYGCIFSMLIIRVFKKARNKDFVTVMSTILVIVFVITINVVTGSMENMTDTEMAAVLYEKGSSIIEVMNNVFPNTILAEKALSNSEPFMLLLFILSAATFVTAFIIIAKLVYIKSVVEMSESNSKGKKLEVGELSRAVRKKSKIKAYVIKEIKLVLRTPIYFMNCVMLSLIWPVIILIPVIVEMFSGNTKETGTAGMEAVASALNSEMLAGICMLVMFGVTILAISFSMVNTTAVSREGKNVIFMKYIPMSFEKQLLAKIIPGIILTLITGTGYSVIGVIIALVALGNISIPLPAVLLGIIISILTCVAFGLAEIISDIIKPKLEWQTEQAAVKQNFIAIIPMFAIMFIGIAMIFGSIYLKHTFEISIYAVAAFAIVLLCLLIAVFYKLDIMLAKKYFAKY